MRTMKKKRASKGTADPIDRYVGSRLRVRRLGLGMSQSKLGQAIGVTFQQVQKYENGANRVGASNLYKMAKALGIDVGFFYDGMPQGAAKGKGKGTRGRRAQPSVEIAGDPTRSREIIALMHNYARIAHPRLQKRVFELVKSMADSPQLR
ncbi:MAG: helix-turn-helix transcriptional regulator [Proteobacteria bacterium]|nr:helix-turn-helix transcriptional regulator [Pseudomonadota bacterium]